jgi:hypothetical protein
MKKKKQKKTHTTTAQQHNRYWNNNNKTTKIENKQTKPVLRCLQAVFSTTVDKLPTEHTKT